MWEGEGDVQALQEVIRGLLSPWGVKRRLARQASLRPETLSRILHRASRFHVSPILADRIVEVLTRVVGLPVSEACLLRTYFSRPPETFRLEPPSVPYDGHRPDPHWIRRRMDDVLDLYRQVGVTFSPISCDTEAFRTAYMAFLAESQELLGIATVWLKSPEAPPWVREGYMEVCTLLSVGLAGKGRLIEAAVYARRAATLAQFLMETPPPADESERIHRAHRILRALIATPVVAYMVGDYRRATETYGANEVLAEDLRRQWHLPEDLVEAWVLDYRLNRLHALSRTGRFRIGAAEACYRACMRTIEGDGVLPRWFPRALRERARRRAGVYATLGLARAHLGYGSTRSRRCLRELMGGLADALRCEDLTIPLRMEIHGTLARWHWAQGDRAGGEAHAEQAYRTARSCGLEGYGVRLVRELFWGPTGPVPDQFFAK